MVRTRFAPSPTGEMHIGNLRTALYAYLIAKKAKGSFILRIEDTDRERYVEKAVDIIYKTLKETRLIHDEGPDIGGEYAPYIQSERKKIYEEYAKKLVEKGGAYYCFCDKERLEKIRLKTGKYDGFCKNLSQEEIEKKLKEKLPYVIRQKIPSEGKTSFIDEVFGEISVENSELDDGVLLKSDGLPTYNFANVIDDYLMNITCVIRGNEYLSSTPKYNLIYEAFGFLVPKYIHVPLIMKENGKKLSKREGDASYADFIMKGYLPDALINYIALLGWSPGGEQEIFSLEELIENFDIKGISKSPSIFDINKLNHINSHYIKSMPLKDFHALALPYYSECDNINLYELSRLLQTRIATLNEIPYLLGFLDFNEDYDIQMFINKKMKSSLELSLEVLKECEKLFENLGEFNEQTIHDTLFGLIKSKGLKNGQVLWPARISISGLVSTPGGAVELAVVLGKDEVLRRIRRSIELLY